MPKTLAAEPSFDPALLALKPRQVLLISRSVMGKESKTSNLESEQKALLIRSVAQYLERCGFSKCFKKLLSEAEIEVCTFSFRTLRDFSFAVLRKDQNFVLEFTIDYYGIDPLVI